MVKKMYVDGYGYTEVIITDELKDIPKQAKYFGFDDEYVFYLDQQPYGCSELWAIPDTALFDDIEPLELDEDDAFEKYFDAVKSDVAWCLGIEEDSDEWWALMDI